MAQNSHSTTDSSFVVLSPADSTSPVPVAEISFPLFESSNNIDEHEVNLVSDPVKIYPESLPAPGSSSQPEVLNSARNFNSLQNQNLDRSIGSAVGDNVNNVVVSTGPSSAEAPTTGISFERIRSPTSDGVSSSCSSTSSSFSEACENLINSESNEASSEMYSEFEAVLRNLRIENESLRAVVDANNAAMKRQLKIVQSWQEEVVNMRKAYQELKSDSEERILRLKHEKDDLIDKLGSCEPRNRSVSRTSVGSESSYFWDSTDFTEFKSKMERIEKLEKENAEKDSQLNEALLELQKSKDRIEILTEEVTELRKQLYGNLDGSGSNDGMISALRAQIRSCQNESLVESQAKMQALNRISQLQQELNHVLGEKQKLEQLLSMGPPIMNLTELPSAPPMSLNQIQDENVAIEANANEQLGAGNSSSRHHRHKHSHHHKESHHSHHKDREAKDASKKLRHLIKKQASKHVANLSSGLTLKAFKEFRP